MTEILGHTNGGTSHLLPCKEGIKVSRIHAVLSEQGLWWEQGKGNFLARRLTQEVKALAYTPELGPQDLHGRRKELTLESCVKISREGRGRKWGGKKEGKEGWGVGAETIRDTS